MSAAEALDPGGGGVEDEEEEEDSCSSSSSSGASTSSDALVKDTSHEDNTGPDAGTGDSSEKSEPSSSPVSRRQKRKNRLRREDSSPASSPHQPSRKNKPTCKPAQKLPSKKHVPLYQYTKLNISDSNLFALLRHYLLSPEELLVLGYPVESSIYPSKAIIYKSPMSSFFFNQPHPPGSNHSFLAASTHFDVNAPEFIPSSKPSLSYGEMKVEWKPRHWPQSSDGASSSGDSDEHSEVITKTYKNTSVTENSDESGPTLIEDFEEVTYIDDPAITQASLNHSLRSDEKKCVRCGRGFFMMTDGEYLTQERCLYHWGKLQRVSHMPDDCEKGDDSDAVGTRMEYDCCRGRRSARGCTTGKLHVWYGVGAGVNGPYDGFVRTRPRKTPPPNDFYGVYAVDCEMCFTTLGLELAKISVVAADGRLVYNTLVRPEAHVVDYNTRFSGITARELTKATKTLRDVQNDLMGFINAHTILIGHGLENDLRALKLIHGTVVDTAVVFPHYYGLPYRRSLKSLVNSYLHRDIQKKSTGHDSLEDARACLELMLWRIRKDFRPYLGN